MHYVAKLNRLSHWKFAKDEFLKRVHLAKGTEDISGPYGDCYSYTTVKLGRQQVMETIINITHFVKEAPSQLIAPLS